MFNAIKAKAQHKQRHGSREEGGRAHSHIAVTVESPHATEQFMVIPQINKHLTVVLHTAHQN